MPAAAREEVRRFEWPCPGDLLQMDTKRLARFSRPGHRVTGDRYRTSTEKRSGVGWEYCHSIIDDHTRLAYTEIHRDEKAPTVTALRRPAPWRSTPRYEITAQRLQTDNACAYIHNRRARASCSPPAASSTAGSRHAPQTQRQDRALPANPRSRMGLRTALPHSDAAPSTPHLAQATTTTPATTAHSPTGHPSAAFGTNPRHNTSGEAGLLDQVRCLQVVAERDHRERRCSDRAQRAGAVGWVGCPGAPGIRSRSCRRGSAARPELRRGTGRRSAACLWVLEASTAAPEMFSTTADVVVREVVERGSGSRSRRPRAAGGTSSTG